MKKLLAILATVLLFGSLSTTLRAQDIQLYVTEHELPNLVKCLPPPPDTIGEAQQAILEQFILIDELVAPGTAGSSLRSAAAAASLLDWAENAELTDEVIGVVIDYMAAKSTEGQAEFGEKLDALDSAVQLLTGADSAAAEGLLGDAGMLDSCGYPWSERAVRTVEGLMQALGRRAG